MRHTMLHALLSLAVNRPCSAVYPSTAYESVPQPCAGSSVWVGGHDRVSSSGDTTFYPSDIPVTTPVPVSVSISVSVPVSVTAVLSAPVVASPFSATVPVSVPVIPFILDTIMRAGAGYVSISLAFISLAWIDCIASR